MSVFNPTVLNNAKLADADGKLDSFLANLAMLGFADSAEKAGEMFADAIAAEKAAKLAEMRDAAHKAGITILDGFSWPVSIGKMMAKLADAVNVADADGKVAPWSISLAVDSEGEMSCKLIAGSTPRARDGKRSSGGKAKLDGKILTAKLLRDEYPDTVAGKIANNKMAPHGIAKMRNGGDYAEGCRFNATQAVKADPILKGRLTFED